MANNFKNPWESNTWGQGTEEFTRWLPEDAAYFTGKNPNTGESADDLDFFSPNPQSGGGISNVGWNYDKIEENYIKDGQRIVQKEHKAGKSEKARNNWNILFGKDTCAIKLSWALNNAGYVIPEHKTSNNRVTLSGNINPKHQYILGADEMGTYLKQKLGTPTFKSDGPIKSDEALENFIKKIEGWKDYGGIIYLDSKNHKEYGATGHVDLIYEDWGNDPYIYGSQEELDDYVDWRNGDGGFNSNAELEVYIWLLKGEKR
ncbi:T6SS effector amidase Tae4 family protein [Chryseobacterium kwangjuense]|uniref:T6SS effector amidase Tae4 family protein n=1 Tax=Chryseobacterium kwangjuense TaxID=267125 RepID=A0A135W6I2_9FLAO|nr:T6SS effector amidase Tae4 family protein [Chryseobacterium kwangjuense]KXH80533.1 hypothetical protein AU378_19260 [Chryseobacterium kwangjuense]